MTCCIAVQCSDGIVMGADSCVMDCGSKYEQTSKIRVFPQHEAIISGSGKAGLFQQVADTWDAHAPGLAGLQQAVRASMRDGMNLNLLYAGRVGIRGIDALGAVTVPRMPWLTTGSGMHLAFGYLYAVLKARRIQHASPPCVRVNLDAEDAASIVRECLEFVAEFECDVDGPFDIVTLPRPA